MQSGTKKFIRQFFFFMISGGIATFTDMTFYSVLVYLGLYYLIANIFSFTLAQVVNYFLNMKLVFKGIDGRDKRIEFLIFFGLSLAGFVLSELLLWLFLNTGYVFKSTTELNVIISKFLAIIIVSVYNFITRKIFLEEKKIHSLKNINTGETK